MGFKHHETRYQFVDSIPQQLEDGILYVSMKYGTAVHKCYCGCGQEVVTPLSPTDWRLTFDGETVTLFPSIGSWSLRCRSHYWVTRNRVEWARSWSDAEINAGRAEDATAKQRYFERLTDEQIVRNQTDAGSDGSSAGPSTSASSVITKRSARLPHQSPDPSAEVHRSPVASHTGRRSLWQLLGVLARLAARRLLP